MIMANNLFGELGNLGGVLGGLVGGLAKSGLVPKDTPEGKLLNAQSKLSNLQQQESDLLIEIGRQAYEQNPLDWPQLPNLELIRQNIAEAQAVLNQAKQEQEHAYTEEQKDECPHCGYRNSEGVKFCEECGNALEQLIINCTSCGAKLKHGSRFCGECGAKQGE
jgi:hypothetical protein